jgi:hypothetical protein
MKEKSISKLLQRSDLLISIRTLVPETKDTNPKVTIHIESPMSGKQVSIMSEGTPQYLLSKAVELIDNI